MEARLLRVACSVTLFAVAAVPSARSQCEAWSGRFGPAGPNGDVLALATFDDGSGTALYVAGDFTIVENGVLANLIARWDGANWSSLGVGISPQGLLVSVDELIVFDDGSGPALYAGGRFTLAGGMLAFNIAKWDGSTWSPLAGGLETPVTDLAVFDDGSGAALYASIETTGIGSCTMQSSRVRKWDGATWTEVGSTTDCVVLALEVFDDGGGPALYAGGALVTPGGLQVANVTRWNGTTWLPVGTGLGHTTAVNSYVAELVAGDDGSGPRLFAGGGFQTSNGSVASGVAKWNGASWSPLPGLAMNNMSVAVRALRFFDDGSGTALFAGGAFATAGGGGNFAKWNGSSWSSPGGGVTGSAFALAVFDDGDGPALHVGGDFTHAGGEPAAKLANWDGSTWDHLPANPGGTNDVVLALHSFNDGSGPALYAGGSFMQAGGVSASRVARYDGVAWQALGAGTNGDVLALASFDDGSGPALYAGGGFEVAGGVQARRAAKWKSGAWSSLASGLNDAVRAMVVFDDGSGPALYAGGNFTYASGVPVNYVARWDGANWSALGSGTDDWVFCMAVFDDGAGPALYAGGTFQHAGGVPANRVAKWDGSTWSAAGSLANPRSLAVFDDGSGEALYAAAGASVSRWNGASWNAVGISDVSVLALAVHDDGRGPALIAGGFYTQIGGVQSKSVARWDGATWTSLDGGLELDFNNPNVVYALAVHDDSREGGPDLYVGGSFDVTFDHTRCENVAEWYGCARPGTMFCFGDGTTVPCPCGNSGSPSRGCQNSAGTGGARLTTSGHLDPDTVVLHVSNELPSALTIFLQGNVQVGPLAFGDGLRCAGGALKRLYNKSASAGSASAPAGSDLSITARSAALGDPIVHATSRYYHTYYRDPNATFCPTPPGSTFNSSNGVEIRW